MNRTYANQPGRRCGCTKGISVGQPLYLNLIYVIRNEIELQPLP